MKPNMRDRSVGIIGLGEHMTRAHLAHIIGPDSMADRIACYDSNPAAIDTALARLDEDGVHISDAEICAVSMEDMLKDPSIGSIFIGSPDSFHAMQLLAAVNAGKHVFCEKPMGIIPDDVEVVKTALALAEKKGLTVSTCHPRRFDPPFLWLKEMIASRSFYDRIGKLKSFEFTFWYHQPTASWKSHRSLLSDHFGHEIDMLTFLFPNASNPYAMKKVFDSSVRYQVRLKTLPGEKPYLEAVFTGYRTLKTKEYIETIRLFGTQGAVNINLNEGICYFERTGETHCIPKMDYGMRFKGITADFFSAMSSGSPPYITHEEMTFNNMSSALLVRDGEFSPNG